LAGGLLYDILLLTRWRHCSASAEFALSEHISSLTVFLQWDALFGSTASFVWN